MQDTQKTAENDLFRQEAITAAAGSQLGDPLETHWRGIRLFIAAAMLALGTLGTLLVLTEYSPYYRVPGFIDVPNGLVRIGAPADGRIVQVPLEEGALVHAGDILAVLNQDQLSLDGGSRSASLRAGIAREQETLTREITAAQEEVGSQSKLTDSEISGLKSERAALIGEMQSGDQLLNSLRSQYRQMAAAAEKGYFSKMDAARKLDELLAQEASLATTRATLARLDRDSDVANQSARVRGEQLRQLIEGKQREREELTRTSLGFAADAEQVLRAPITGIVTSKLVTLGQTVTSGQTLFHLVPAGEPMVLRLLVPPRAAGRVRSGMHIKVAFDAFPREQYGDFEARIDQVSDSPILPGEFVSFVTTTTPGYLATATLTRVQSGGLRLKPGMLAQGFVPLEKRRAIEWLFYPLIRGFQNSADRATGNSNAPGKSPPARDFQGTQ